MIPRVPIFRPKIVFGQEKKCMRTIIKGDYSNLITDLKTVVKKDTNVLLLIKALKILTVLSSGLREGFKNYGALLISETLTRFKEKKATVKTFISFIGTGQNARILISIIIF